MSPKCAPNRPRSFQHDAKMRLLGASWRLLAARFLQLGVKLAYLGPSWAHLGASWGDLGAHFADNLPPSCPRDAQEHLPEPSKPRFLRFRDPFCFSGSCHNPSGARKANIMISIFVFLVPLPCNTSPKKHKLKIVFWHFCNATGHQKSKFSKTVKNKFSNRSSTNTNHIAELWGPAVNREASSI